jgi:predicted SAM-dependent methyltransferase
MGKKLRFTEHEEDKTVRLDLGTGKGRNRPEGFIGVDIDGGDGVKKVDLRKPWPWKNNSVDEARADYLIQYLTASERKFFANELYRVLKPDAVATVIVPIWSAQKAYQDIDVRWPPVAEGWFHVLSKNWREAQNYIVRGYECDFESSLGYGMHQMIMSKNDEYKQFAVGFYKEAAQDIHVTLTKRE